MAYARPLPSIRSLGKLASWDGPFPMKAYRMVVGADHYGFGEDMLAFLALFPHDMIFHDRHEFLERCKELESSIALERSATLAR